MEQLILGLLSLITAETRLCEETRGWGQSVSVKGPGDSQENHRITAAYPGSDDLGQGMKLGTQVS